jgi:hypothetical protein
MDDMFLGEMAAHVSWLFLGAAQIGLVSVWVLGSTGDKVTDERTPADPTSLMAHRPTLEQGDFGSKERDVHTIVIRPAVVYGRKAAVCFLLTMLVQSARPSGTARYVGD